MTTELGVVGRFITWGCCGRGGVAGTVPGAIGVPCVTNGKLIIGWIGVVGTGVGAGAKS